MDPDRFDRLARDFAGGLSRRGFLKALAGGAAGTLLAMLGYKPLNEYAYASPMLASTSQVYLPLVAKGCAQASACGNRQYCADNECLCIRSAEGDIRCGKIPNTCYMQLCSTSADCAHLGPGYFCDTPNSGCCYDPPAELPRCIAPCTIQCPSERTCGSDCCPEGQFCIGGKCGVCPPERVCGNQCCPPGERCADGVCLLLRCPDDPVTLESLAAAKEALDAGANEVPFSPDGCVNYRRVFTNGTISYEEIKVEGKVMLKWDISEKKIVGQRDPNLDGFFEWRSTTDVGASLEEFTEEVVHYSQPPRSIYRREVHTRQGEVVHILWEEADANGTLRPVARFVTGIFATASAADNPLPGSINAPNACSEAQLNLLNKRLEEAFKGGIECLAGNNFDAMADLAHLKNRLKYLFTCVNIPPAPNGQQPYAKAQWLRVLGMFIGNVEMMIDPSYFNASERMQRQVMFHELLHLHFGMHDESVELESPRRDETDRIYACAAMCFDPDANRCSCASCLKTDVCDLKCQKYKECSDTNLGAKCPCDKGKNAHRWFATCTECLETCPSGLGCSGYSTCDVISVGCESTPITCP